MSGFSLGWLALREPYDHAARDGATRAAALAGLAELPSVAIVDLGCGAGSNLRALAPHIPSPQRWTLVDNDLSLLARALEATPANVTARGVPIDLAHDLELALDGPVDLVTTSALLDLVSEDWLERLVTEIAARRLPLYATLTYDGRATLDPVDPLDARIVEAVNRHQRGDKGFGPALGPAAAQAAVARFKAVGYAVHLGASDWTFTGGDRDVQREVVDGWAAAALELGNLPVRKVEEWLARRQEHIASGRAAMRVGHMDLYARPE